MPNADGQKQQQAKHEEREAEKRRAEAIHAHFNEFVEAMAEKGWKYISKAKLMHKSGQPPCLFMTSENGQLIQFMEYSIAEKFHSSDPQFLSINQVISLNIARPDVTDSRKKTVHLPITESQEKSPVARGLAGGAIMGPAGLILGAASGLNSRTKTRIETKTVYEQYEKKGDPQLIVGTSSPDVPVLKLKFDPPSLADEWMFRIRALQSGPRT